MFTQIQIMVAVDDCGNVDCIPSSPYNVQMQRKAAAFLEAKKSDKRDWQISYLTAHVPVPATPIIEATVTNKP
jgi:hypothetical protein